MGHEDEKQRPGGGLCSGVILRFGSLLACLAITAEPALAQSPNPLLPRNLSPWGMFLSADIVVQAVMIGLAFASLGTCTVWLAKTVGLSGKKRLRRRRPTMAESRRHALAAHS